MRVRWLRHLTCSLHDSHLYSLEWEVRLLAQEVSEIRRITVRRRRLGVRMRSFAFLFELLLGELHELVVRFFALEDLVA